MDLLCKLAFFLEKQLSVTYLNRRFVFLTDTLLSVFSTIFSVWLLYRFIDLHIDVRTIYLFSIYTCLASILWIFVFKTYRGVIRHTTVSELMRIFYAMGAKMLTLVVLCKLSFEYVGNFVMTQLVCDFFCSVFLLSFVRVIIVNVYNHLQSLLDRNLRPLMIYGTSEIAVSFINYLKTSDNNYNVVGFFSRNSNDKDIRIMGYPVYYLPKEESVETLFDKINVAGVLFMNSEDIREDQDLLDYGLNHHLNLQVLPLQDNQEISKQIEFQIRDVRVEDLLGRKEININMKEISEMVKDKTVMVTGAAGSIGSELCRQFSHFPFKKLILFDNAETPMHNLCLEMNEMFPDKQFIPVLGDVRNQFRLEHTFEQYHPQLIFHAAAYKHVPLMESNPCEAVRTNVRGTRVLADLAVKYEVEKFVMISTDKAVNPSSVMGASKRIAEIYVQSLGHEIRCGMLQGVTRFITTRFGNVLGSNGSVIPRFREQLLKGGPLTVTHPDIIRYFMTIPEACRLVMEAAFMGKGEEIFVFDMGKPVKIVNLAKRMIQLAGFTPNKDIQIVFTGLRPGEKLYEELLNDREKTLPTSNKQIFRARVREYIFNDVVAAINQLTDVALKDDKITTVKLMKQLVAEFKSLHSAYEVLDNN